ncbi:MAG: DUF2092 domain-containing protein [Candidatus Contendobacter sp.]|nr:DUF2092 domain-containing protein [Candidatus Contendobacter sp.]
MQLNKISGMALGSLLALSGQALAAGVPEKETSPDPNKIVQRMCDYLKSLDRFSFRAEITDDQVYTGGKKLQYAFETETFVQRPDKLRVNAEGDLVKKQFFLEGKTLTLYDPADKVYATVEVPADIEGALAKADQELKFRVALADLASPKLCEHLAKGQTHALYVGSSKVRGVSTDHLAFDRNDIQFQLWIALGEKPVPVKILINQKNLPAAPQWTAYVRDWNNAPQLKPGTFAFTAPTGVQKIKFVSPPAPVSASTAAQLEPVQPVAEPAAQPAKTGEKP